MKVIMSRHADFNRHGIEVEVTDDDLRKEHPDWDDKTAQQRANLMMRFCARQCIQHNLTESVITPDQAKAQIVRWNWGISESNGSAELTQDGDSA